MNKINENILTKKADKVKDLCKSVINRIESADSVYKIYDMYELQTADILINELSEMELIAGILLENSNLEVSIDEVTSELDEIKGVV